MRPSFPVGSCYVTHLLVGITLLVLPLPNAWSQSSSHQNVAKLGVLVDLHEPISWVGKADRKTSSVCGPLNLHAYQQLIAVKWAVETINNKSWPGEFELDLEVHDTCGESGTALTETHHLLNSVKENDHTPLIGVIAIGSRNNERIVDRPLESLNNANISAIVTSSKTAGLVLSKHPNVFTTAPDISSVTEGITALINQLGATDVAVISACTHAVKMFQRISKTKSIQIEHTLIIDKDNDKLLDAIIKFYHQEANKAQTFVLLLESTELENMISDADSRAVEEFQHLVQEKSWILGSVGTDEELIKDWSSKFQSTLLILQPHVAVNSDFQTYFVNKLKRALVNNEDAEAVEYVEGVFHCRRSKSKIIKESDVLMPVCRNLSSSYMNKKVHPESEIGFIVDAVSAYSAALRSAQLESCQNDTKCDRALLPNAVTDALRRLNFPMKYDEGDGGTDPTEPTVASSHELEGTRGRINFQGKLVSRKYDLFISRPNGKISQIGQYSKDDGLILHVMLGMNLEGGTSILDGNGKPLGNVPRGKTRISMRRGKTAKNGESQDYVGAGLEESVNVRRMMSSPEFYISRVWAMVVIAIAITGVFISLYMLVYVLQRMCDGTLNGNQVLGILLLLGIIMMYASVVLFVLPPSKILCNLRVFVPSIATSVCFGILLLKAMQLRSFVSLGLGGRVSALNQFITLIFIVAVQLAVNVQWFFSPHPQHNFQHIGESFDTGLVIQECFYSPHHFLYLHTYLGALISIVFFYGTSVLKIRRNYNEAKWITLASCLSLPIAVAWAVVVHQGPPDFQEPAACVTFIAIATVLLFSIFIPKLSTISQQSSLKKRKKMLQNAGPGHTGSISTIFTTLSDRGTLQSHKKKRNGSSHPSYLPQSGNYTRSNSPSQNSPYYPPAPPPMPSSNGKSVTYSPRLTTNFYHSSPPVTSLVRGGSMKTPLFFDSGRAAYP